MPTQAKCQETSLIDFLPSIAVVSLIALVWFFVARDSAKEPFMAALIEKYPAKDNSARDINLKRHFFGTINAGNLVVRTSGVSKLAVTHDSLFIAQPPLINKLFPTIEIPLRSLSRVDSRFYWSAVSRFDTFEIDGISGGKLLLPVGLVGEYRRHNEEC